MNSMSKSSSFMSWIKGKIAGIISSVLIKQAEEGVKFSWFILISESKIPDELLVTKNKI